MRSGVSGFEIAFARRLNSMLRRKGKVWDDRYHRHDLKTPRETAVGYAYLFDNFTHHGEWSFGDGVLDLHSSAWLFDGWNQPHVTFDESERWRWPICSATTWLARVGYLKHGRLVIRPRHP
jgi:hypothetical protein